MAKGENLKFYDMKGRKVVFVPEEKTWVEIKGKRRTKMRVAYAPGGNLMYRIMGKAKPGES